MSTKQDFIDTYEKKVKELRENYYKNKIKNGLGDNILIKSIIIINYLPLVLSIILCIVGKFSLKSKIVATIFLLISSYFLAIIKKKYNILESKYESTIRKMGFLSINQYEKNIAKYITGKNGYYDETLQKIITDNKIAEDKMFEVKDLKDRTYLLYDNKEKDELFIINNNLKDIPRLVKIKYSNIRYYRHDKLNNRIILKTDLDEWYYKEDSKTIFAKIMPDKKIETINSFKPDEYINDFEKYMKEIKEEDIIKKEENNKIKNNIKNKLLPLFLLLIIFMILSAIYKEYHKVLNIIHIVLLIATNHYLLQYLQVKNIFIKDDNEYIKYLNNNKDCQDKFAELKLALNIPREIEKIYSDEGAEFLVWDNGGYFHLFLNLIYFDVIYISVKITDVDYYKEDNNLCELKIKGKNYYFTLDSIKVFSKLLPNKDYNWIKGLQVAKK